MNDVKAFIVYSICLLIMGWCLIDTIIKAIN